MTKRVTLKPLTLALLTFIRRQQPVATHDAFSVFEGAGECVKAFSARLHYLRQVGWLINTGSNCRGIWSLTEKAVALIEDDADEPGPVVPPRRIDLMSGPLYSPPAMSYREGALDFEACPSAIAGRPVPFRGGHHG